MNRLRTAGIALTVVGVVGYVAGTVEAYPGRSASVIGVMVGVTLYSIGRSIDRETAE
ncbi:hypothetical protein [Halopelagius longus]|uniref:Uncharacterized protein n=1 Tax=Halopelagius longus TaxID=1236180 RepID=A0A1H1ABN9_9EURY|nr:hypothetical protein [Halopelagius longus]SDQ37168.1 hypothetical protein SAMN05216278_1263 [Halopelagius longus]